MTGPVVEIDSLYCPPEIFQDLLHNMGDSECLCHLFDAAVHVLAAQEALSDLSKRDFYVQMLKRELEGGGFSASVIQAPQLPSREQKRGMAFLLLTQCKTGSSLLVFRQALTVLYPQAVLCQLKPHPERFLLYLGLANAGRRIVRILEDLFLPLQYQVRIFWTKYFGVWDVNIILVFDEIEIH